MIGRQFLGDHLLRADSLFGDLLIQPLQGLIGGRRFLRPGCPGRFRDLRRRLPLNPQPVGEFHFLLFFGHRLLNRLPEPLDLSLFPGQSFGGGLFSALQPGGEFLFLCLFRLLFGGWRRRGLGCRLLLHAFQPGRDFFLFLCLFPGLLFHRFRSRSRSLYSGLRLLRFLFALFPRLRCLLEVGIVLGGDLLQPGQRIVAIQVALAQPLRDLIAIGFIIWWDHVLFLL